jgi:hypothetical protein
MSSEYKIPARKTVLKRTDYPISAECCLWFAWAPPGFVGPKGEAASSTPVFDVKPPGATQVTVSVVNNTEKWGHSPDVGRHSGARGLDGSNGTPVDARGLEMPEYQDAKYNSQFINSLHTHLNKLIMILEKDDAAPTALKPGVQEIVGESNTFSVSADVTRIFIGMHDGHHWNNNKESIRVSVQWL